MQLATRAPAQDALLQIQEQAVADAVNFVSVSVVQIDTIGGVNPDGESGTGPFSGTIVSADGLVLTSGYNLAHKPASIVVRMPDGSRRAAEIVIHDQSRNLVLLRILEDESDGNAELNLQPVTFVSRDELKPGETAIAVGRVYDWQATNVSVGIVSATERIWGRAVQTDAKISPANYGGPLINLKGEVIGVLTPLSTEENSPTAGAGWYDSGIGFAADPHSLLERTTLVDTANGVAEFHPGICGVAFKGSNIYADAAEVAVSYVGSPAYQAGIRAGDVITSFAGKPVMRQAQFKHAIGPLYAGETVSVVVARGDEELQFEMQLVSELPPFEIPAIGIVPDNSGVTAAEENPNSGLTVRHVFTGSAAAKAGIKVGDRITKFGDSSIVDRESFERALMRVAVGESVAITLDRNDSTVSLNLTIENQQSTAERIEANRPADSGAELTYVIVADAANLCFAIHPTGGWNSAPSLLIWLARPGEIRADAGALDPDRPGAQESFAVPWLEHCAAQNVIVLVIAPENEMKWDPGESEVIMRAVEITHQQFPFDRRRVAIGGLESGGAMAATVTVANRQRFTGLALIDSPFPKPALKMETSAVGPLLLFVGSTTRFDRPEQLDSGIEAMKAAKFPIHVESAGSPKIDDWIAKLLGWVDLLDRM